MIQSAAAPAKSTPGLGHRPAHLPVNKDRQSQVARRRGRYYLAVKRERDTVVRPEAPLSLRWKINLTVGLTLLAAVGVVLLVSQTVFMRGFETVEQSEVQEQVKRAQTAVKWNLDELGAAVKSYSSWDDSVAFLEDGNQRFIDSNFPDSFFTGFKANMAAMLDETGALVWGSGYDLESYHPADLPFGLVDYLSADSMLARHPGVTSEVSGILMLPQGPMLVDSQPILTSDGKGPVRGAFVLGRWLDETTLAQLGTQTRLDLTVTEASAETLPLQVQEAVAAPDAGAEIVVIPLGPETVAGYAVLRDIFGKPAVVMQVDVPRAIYAQGAASVRYFMLSLLALVLIFGIVLNRLLEHSLFRRLASLTAQLRHIRPSRGNLTPIPVDGRTNSPFWQRRSMPVFCNSSPLAHSRRSRLRAWPKRSRN